MDVSGMNPKGIRTDPFRLGTYRSQQEHQRFDVADSRNVLECDLVGRQQGRGHDGQRRVLVSSRPDRPGQLMSTFHHIPQCGHAHAPDRGQSSAVKVPDSWRQVKRRGAPRIRRQVRFGMTTIPVLALIADTLLVRPVDVPAPWYNVATGILSIVVTLLLLGIAAAVLGIARAVRGAEHNLGKRFQGLSDELIPLVRNLNQVATQLSEVTTAVRKDLGRLSGTVGAVDDAVRDALDASQHRLAQFATLVDAVQDEAEATIASATGLMRGVRAGVGTLFSDVLGRGGMAGRRKARRAARRSERSETELDESDVRSRLAALEAAFEDGDEDDDEDEDDDVVVPTVRPRAESTRGNSRGDQSEEWMDDDDDDDLGDNGSDDDEDSDDAGDDASRDVADDGSEDGDDEADDESEDGHDAADDELEDGDDDADDEEIESERPSAGDAVPRSGGPRIRRRRRG